MSKKESNRRNFLKYLGLSVGTTLLSTNVFASFINESELKKLNFEQQEFMIRYGKWMDEFVEGIKLQKEDPENLDYKKSMLEISNNVKELQPELNEFMKDETFALIYKESIKRVTKEI